MTEMRVVIVVLVALAALAAGQTPCPEERCPVCQSLCNPDQSNKCTSWCYNIGAAGECTEHCYNLGPAPKCKNHCYSAIGGFNITDDCDRTCVDPTVALSSVDYYPRQSDAQNEPASLNVGDDRIFDFRGADASFSLSGVTVSIKEIVTAGDAVEKRVDNLNVRLGAVQSQANEADSDIASLNDLTESLTSRVTALEGDGTAGSASVSSNYAAISDLKQELDKLAGTGSASGVSVQSNAQRITTLEERTDTLIEDLASQTDHPDLSGTLASEIVEVKNRVATNEQDISALQTSVDNVYTKTEVDNKFVPQAGTDECTSAKQGLLRFQDDKIEQCADGAWKDIKGGSTGGSGGTPVILRPNGCSELLDNKPETTDGIHEVAIDDKPAEHYCLMSLGGLSLGGDGSDAPNAGYSCETIFHRFQKSDDGIYWVNPEINEDDGGVAVKVFCNMHTLDGIDPNGDGSSFAKAAFSCASLRAFHPLISKVSKSYWIKGKSVSEEVYCDMDTQGGGWTLVAKVRGMDATLNGRNTAQWRDGTVLGSIKTLADENAVGKAYSSVPFTDVMIRGLGDGAKSIGWRHPQPFSSVKKVVNDCQPVRSGKKLWGLIENLDYPTAASPERYRECDELDFGFLISDASWSGYSLAGCDTAKVSTGHTGSIFAAASNTAESCVYGVDDGYCRYCVTNWGIGSGYAQMDSTDDLYAINAHWWGNGNTDVFRWNTHAAFVRQPVQASLGGDGSSPQAAGASCQMIKDKFGGSGLVERHIIAFDGKVSKGYCDFGSTAGDKAQWLGGNGATFHSAGLRCDTIRQLYSTLVSGAYYIIDPEHQAIKVYCDMTTEGGGWTLLAKVIGEDPTMNAKNMRQWRNGEPIGTPEDLSNKNTLARTYGTVAFNEVMIRSLSDNNFRIGWRHPNSYPSAMSIVKACSKIDDGELMFGSVDRLDYDGNGDFWSACSELQYGWFTNDWTQTDSRVAGCATPFGHASGVAGAGIPPIPKSYGADDGTYRNCISNMNIGSGYGSMSTQDDSFAINSHFWGAGNDNTHTWNDHALMVRMSGPYLNLYDGSDITKPGKSCSDLKAMGQTTTKNYWILPRGADAADGAIEVRCDMTGAGVNLGNDGSSEKRPGRSCKVLKDVFEKTESRAYYIMGLKGKGVLIYCDQATEGGGWTLVAKVRGNDPFMNSKNTRQWRSGIPIGDQGSIKAENALTEAYSTVAFTDVMIRSPGNVDRRLGWRHPAEHSSVRDIILQCQQVSDGTKLFGSIQNLDHPAGNEPARYNECTAMRYGFMLNDWTQKDARVAGCWRVPYGHAAGVFGGAIPVGDYQYGTHDGAYRRCLSTFGIGSGYGNLAATDDAFAINAHWWGNGNTDVYSWGDQAVFVR